MHEVETHFCCGRLDHITDMHRFGRVHHLVEFFVAPLNEADVRRSVFDADDNQEERGHRAQRQQNGRQNEVGVVDGHGLAAQHRRHFQAVRRVADFDAARVLAIMVQPYARDFE